MAPSARSTSTTSISFSRLLSRDWEELHSHASSDPWLSIRTDRAALKNASMGLQLHHQRQHQRHHQRQRCQGPSRPYTRPSITAYASICGDRETFMLARSVLLACAIFLTNFCPHAYSLGPPEARGLPAAGCRRRFWLHCRASDHNALGNEPQYFRSYSDWWWQPGGHVAVWNNLSTRFYFWNLERTNHNRPD